MATKIPYDQGSGLLRVVRSDSSFDEAYCTSIELNIILQDSEVRVFEVKSFGYTILRVDQDLIVDLGAFTDYSSVQDAYDDVFNVLTAMLAGIGGGGSGDVTTSGTVLDEEIVIYDGTTGDSIKSSGLTIPQLLALIFDGAITVDAATTAVLAGSPTYANGAAGVGATLTRGSNGVFPTIDGVAAALNNTYLVKNQASSLQNGVYLLTTLGSGGAPWVLTRTTDSDQVSELYPQVVIVAAGTVNKRRIYSQTNGALTTIGTDAITYGTTPAPNLTGYVKADGTVDFTGAETWDFGGTDTTVIADTGVTVADATDSMTIVKDQITATDGTAVAGFTRLGVGVADGGANQGNLLATEANVIGANGEVRIYEDRIKMVHGATSAAMEKKFIKVSLSAVQIKGGNSTPPEVIAAPEAGKFIDVISCVAVYTFVSEAFTSGSFHLDCGGGDLNFLFTTVPNFVSSTVNLTAKLYPNIGATDNSIIIENTPILAMFDVDSASGDGKIDLYIEYNVITL